MNKFVFINADFYALIIVILDLLKYSKIAYPH